MNYTIFELTSEGEAESLHLWFVGGSRQVAGEYFIHRVMHKKNPPNDHCLL